MNDQTFNIIIVIIIVLFVICLISPSLSFSISSPNAEGFNGWGRRNRCPRINKMASYPVGYPEFGLRGDLLMTRPIQDLYISPYRQIRLSMSGADMYESDYSPPEQGVPNCKKVACPENGYDSMDTCWQCDDPNPQRMRIPDLWPHGNTQ